MAVIAKKILKDFWENHNDSEQQLNAWFQETNKAFWKNPNDEKKEYPKSSILNNNRIVFKIKGNVNRRKLSLEMIRQLHEKLHIPTDVLIQAY